MKASFKHMAATVAAAMLGTALNPVAAHAGTRFAPTTTDTGQVYDLVIEYMFNNGDALHFGSDPNQIQQDFFEGAPINKLYYVKQTNTTFWERFGITDSAIALERDTTAPPGSPNNSYDAAPHGSMGMPRVWTVGQETSFSTTIKWFDKTTCRYTGRQDPWAHGRHFLRYQGPISMGGSLGTVDVVIIDRYHWISDNPATAEYYNSPEAERFWFARGRGWVRWDLFSNRTTGKWNYSDPTSLLNPGATQTVLFTTNSPNNNSKTPNKLCNGGVF